MNPGIVALAFVVLSVTYTMVNIVLPTFNMHLRMNREEILRQTVLTIVNQNRNQPTVLNNLLNVNNQNLQIQGIEIDDISASSVGQYNIYTIRYSESGVFFNQFFKPSGAGAQAKQLEILVDRVL